MNIFRLKIGSKLLMNLTFVSLVCVGTTVDADFILSPAGVTSPEVFTQGLLEQTIDQSGITPDA